MTRTLCPCLCPVSSLGARCHVHCHHETSLITIVDGYGHDPLSYHCQIRIYGHQEPLPFPGRQRTHLLQYLGAISWLAIANGCFGKCPVAPDNDIAAEARRALSVVPMGMLTCPPPFPPSSEVCFAHQGHGKLGFNAVLANAQWLQTMILPLRQGAL